MDPEQRQEKSERIRARLFKAPWYRDAASLFTFMNFRSEVETLPIVMNALEAGKRVLLPRIDKKKREMQAVVIEGPGSLVINAMGIREPAPGLPPYEGSVDLLLAPGLAFDLQGYRLGYGGGYYDRYLSSHPPRHAAGLAFETQIIETLPRDEHDQRLDYLISEKRLISFDKKEEKKLQDGA